MGGISIWQLLIIAVIVILLFGTNKLRSLGSDLGSAIKGFKKAIGDDKDEKTALNSVQSSKQEPSKQDADFKPDALQSTDAKADDAKNSHKEQV